MRLTLLLTFGLVFGGPIWAEEPDGGILAGRVTLGEQGLAGVTVTATGTVTAQAVTTLDGTYQLAGLPAGAYTLALTQDGIEGSPPVRSVVLRGQAISALDFVASPIAPALPTVRLTPSTSLARPGDTLTLRLTLTPGTQEPVADLYLLFLPPGAPLPPRAPGRRTSWCPQSPTSRSPLILLLEPSRRGPIPGLPSSRGPAPRTCWGPSRRPPSRCSHRTAEFAGTPAASPSPKGQQGV